MMNVCFMGCWVSFWFSVSSSSHLLIFFDRVRNKWEFLYVLMIMIVIIITVKLLLQSYLWWGWIWIWNISLLKKASFVLSLTPLKKKKKFHKFTRQTNLVQKISRLVQVLLIYSFSCCFFFCLLIFGKISPVNSSILSSTTFGAFPSLDLFHPGAAYTMG